MSDDFEVYRRWLGIPVEEQPPHHYRLLGIALFEADPDVIEEATDRQMAHVHRHKLGPHGAKSQELLNEISAAKVCLLKKDLKAAYDAQLRAKLAATAARSSSIGRAAPPVATRVVASPAPVAVNPAAALDFVYEQPAPAARRAQSKKAKAKSSSGVITVTVGALAALVVIVAIGWNLSNPAKPVSRSADGSDKAKPTISESASKPDEKDERPSEEQGDDVDIRKAPATASIDLLKITQPSQHRLNGNWTKSRGNLALLAGKTPSEAHPKLIIPYHPPEEYQIDMTVVRRELSEVVLGLVVGQSQVAVILDGWGGESSGLHQVDGKTGDANSTTHHGTVIRNGRPHRVRYVVRKDQVTVTCNDQPVIDWHGSSAQLALEGDFIVPDKRGLFLAGMHKGFTITQLELTPLSSSRGEVVTTSPPQVAVATPQPAKPQPETPQPEKPKPPQPQQLPLPPKILRPQDAPKTPADASAIVLEGHRSGVRSVAIAPDGKRAASNDYLSAGQSNLLIWDLETKRLADDRNAFSIQYNSMLFSRDGQKIMAGSNNTSICWLAADGAHQTGFGFGFAIFNVALSPDERIGAVGGPGRIAVFENPEQPAGHQELSGASDGPVTGLAFLPSNQQLLSVSGGSWNNDSPAESTDDKLHVWNLATREHKDLAGHRGSIWALASSSDGQRVATGGSDGTIRLWDPRSGRSLKTLAGHQGPVYSLAMTRDGAWLVSGGADKTVRLWNLKAGKEARQFAGHTALVRSVAISDDGRTAISGSNDRTVRVWNSSSRPAPGPSPPVMAVTIENRAEVPDEAAQKATLKLVRDIYADGYKQAKKPAEKIALAERLLESAGKAQDPVEKFVLYSEARSLAAAGGAPALVIQLYQELGSRFKMPTDELIADSLEEMNREALPGPARKELAEGLLPIADQAVEQENLDLAKRLLVLALNAARKTSDKQLANQIAARGNEVVELRRSAESIKAADVQLKQHPDDPEANLSKGKFLCFMRDAWADGLPHLAKGSDASLAEVAKLELAASDKAEDMVKVGDAWWNLADAAKGKDKSVFQSRSEHWYTSASPQLTGLSKTKISKRLEELAGAAAKAKPSATTSTTSDKPAATGATKGLAARIRVAAKQGTFVKPRMAGGGYGVDFFDISDVGMLVGFNYTLEERFGSGYFTSIQPIYQGAKGTVVGQAFGLPNAQVRTLMAKKGYAIAGIRATCYSEFYGLEATFNAVEGGVLDPKKSYTSEWIGSGNGSGATKMGNDGQPIIGIYGRMNGSDLVGFGVVQLPKP